MHTLRPPLFPKTAAAGYRQPSSTVVPIAVHVSGSAESADIAPDPLAAALASLDDSAPPEVVEILETLESGEGSSRIETSRFRFRSRGGANVVFAILCRPVATSAPRPALLFFHGGSSSAEAKADVTADYARNGYVALACDLPGICDPAKAPHSSGAWSQAALGEGPRFSAESGAVNSTLVDGLNAAIDAFRLMRARSDVDPARIGVTGQSWGGYTAIMVAGLLGDRVRAVYSLWGSGFFDQGSFWSPWLADLDRDTRDTWLAWLDAGRRASDITAPLFIEGATNDTYFWPPAVESTLAAAPGVANRVWWANLDHAIDREAAPTRRLFLDHHLKNEGLPFGSVSIISVSRLPDGRLEVLVKAATPVGVSIDSVRIYFGRGGPDWTKRPWTAVGTKPRDGVYVATLPAESTSEDVYFYPHLTDSRRVSVSGVIVRLAAAAS